MKRICIVYMACCFLGSLQAQNLPGPTGLRTDLLLNTHQVSKSGFPVAVNLYKAVENEQYQYATILQPNPSFDWISTKAFKGISAYCVLLASSPELLKEQKADYWDSKKIMGKQHPLVYNGKPLQSGKTYYWQVQEWDGAGKASAFSAISSFYLATNQHDFSHSPLAASYELPIAQSREKNGTYYLDFGKDGFAQLLLQFNSDQTDSVFIEAAEAMDGGNGFLKNNGNIRYIKLGLLVEKGLHAYQVKWPVNEKRNSRNPIQMPNYIGEVFPFRYVAIRGYKGNLDQGMVKRKLVYYPFDEQASYFHSSDTVLNKVWDLCKYSIKATSFSGYYLDGDRERVPYEADALINQLSHYAVDAEYSIARRSMAYLIDHPTWPTEWSLQNVLMAWNDYLYTGDLGYLKKYYPELQLKMLMPLEEPNGLISTLTGKQTKEFLATIHITKAFDGKQDLKDIVDWPRGGGYIGKEKQYEGEIDGFVFCKLNSVVNAFYYRNLVLMSRLAKVLGKEADGVFYEQKSKEAYQSFQQVFVDAKTGLVKDGDTTNHSSLHANMFALAFNLVPTSNKTAVVNFIKTRQMACSVFGSQFLLDGLYDAGEAEYALELLTSTKQRSWYNMIRSGSTITMEAWDKVYKPNLDLNHAWGAAPANLIVRKLMGVEPIEAGGSVVKIKPQLGHLQFAQLSTSFIRGKINIDYHLKGQAAIYQFSIPAGIVAQLELKVPHENARLWLDGKLLNIQAQNGKFYFDVADANIHLVELK
jgi:hypothetical protein